MPSMLSDAAIAALRDMDHHINLATDFIAGFDYDAFRDDTRTVFAVTRCLEIISEASRRLPDEMKARYPSIAWKNIAGAGNVLRQPHGHFGRKSRGAQLSCHHGSIPYAKAPTGRVWTEALWLKLGSASRDGSRLRSICVAGHRFWLSGRAGKSPSKSPRPVYLNRSPTCPRASGRLAGNSSCIRQRCPEPIPPTMV
jgi:uncharacterized protein with HEPN domain